MISEAEESVIGGAFLGPEFATVAAEALGPEMFSDNIAREIFQVILDMYWAGEKLDAVTILPKVPQYKVQIALYAQKAPTLKNYSEYVRIVADEYKREQFTAGIDKILLKTDPFSSILSQMEELTANFKRLETYSEVNGAIPISQAIADFVEWVQSGKPDTVTAGFKQLDSMTGGFMKGAVFTIAARPGGGKTDFCINLATRMAKRGFSVLYFTLEMPINHLMQRIVANALDINGSKIRDKALNEAEIAKVMRLTQNVAQWGNLEFVEEQGISYNRVEQFVKAKHPDIIFIDHLGLMKRADAKESYRQIGILSNQMHELAICQHIAVVQLVQMNRQIDTRKGDPSLSDIRESGDIEQDSDYIAFIRPELLKDKTLTGTASADCKLFLEKCRPGSTGVLSFKWQPQYHRYMEVENRYD